ncbi:uncharacterized protein LOC120623531 [Pararge aegeria]|uniref:uncharacterized protein LOC120623531 n=1 Tax=Pararge aegeria TaxID=116150 RepID=UPI0019D1847C|nr:uncharacterized protein LOC120623531 [Pararge aegeria]
MNILTDQVGKSSRLAQSGGLKRSAVGLFTPPSGDVGGGRIGSGGCVAGRARVPGRFVIATEAVVCRRWSVRALVRTASYRETWPACRREHALGARESSAASRSPRTVPVIRSVHVLIISSSLKRIPEPAIVARCKEAATVNPCAQGGEWRHVRARWLRRPADSMRAAARLPAPT